MEALMADCVRSNLCAFLYRNAIFICERLCAEFPSENNMQLLATCYLRNGQGYAAYHILKGMQMAPSRYLFALSCFQMNLLHEAEVALCPTNDPSGEIPNGAAGHYLLGLVYRYTDRRLNAITQFVLALKLDPLLWAAFEELCILGAVEDGHRYFSDSVVNQVHLQHPAEFNLQNLQTGGEDFVVSCYNSVSVSDDASQRQFSQMHTNKEGYSNSHGGQPSNSGQSCLSLYSTPSPLPAQLSCAPPPPCRNALQNFNITVGEGPTRFSMSNAAQAPRRKFMDEGKLRKVSGRLFADSIPRRSTRLAVEASSAHSNMNPSVTGANLTSISSSKIVGGSSPSSKLNAVTLRSATSRKVNSCTTENLEEDSLIGTLAAISCTGDCKCLEQLKGCYQHGRMVAQGSRSISGTLELLSLLRVLGEAYRLSCTYNGQEALEVYLKLSSKQYNTAWVLSQVGKAYFELVDYGEAERAFNSARRLSPYIFEGMDIYSTVLYHLNEDMRLSYLAQELITVDRSSPQAWCAMGNCYSLQKDHETALKNFQRSVHLDHRYTYAHTLCGHEYAALDDYENAIKCYQSALQLDERHYNSWYGLGCVYLRQQKFQFAEHHFRKALHINACSSVLMCYLGRTLHELKRNEEALLMFEKATISDRNNPVPMFEKANLLVNLERYDEALKLLEHLKENSPGEGCIYSLLGKIYQKQNMPEKSLIYFGLALDQNPPPTDISSIKAAMEKLLLPDELEDE